MNSKNDTKRYLKINLLTFLIVLILASPSIFIQKVSADFESLLAHEVYKIAWGAINEKFYFKTNSHIESLGDRFKNKINCLADAHKYINKLIKELNDPYTKFLTREEFKDEQDIINASFVGIGIKLASNIPLVLDVIARSPADKVGIKKGDYVIAIDGKSTRFLTISQIAELLRGPKDSFVSIKLKRGNEIIPTETKREELNFKSVSTKLLPRNIALIKIDSFVPENTSKLFKEELLRVMSANGLILDLRNNSGGLLKNAIEIADMFLSEGKIISTIYNTKNVNEFANSNKIFNSNVIILVNENTASASEVLSSALRENNRAILIGKKTFGKGLVQEIVKLPDDSALHVTTAAYLTPNGKNIDKIGLMPDEIIFEEDKQMERAKEILLGKSKKLEIASL